MSKVVVFGGSGFLGSHVADVLSDKGYTVYIFDKYESPYLRSDQHMFTGDLLNFEEVDAAIKGADYVYNFAAVADIKEAQEKPVDTVKVNILGATYILESCVKHKVKRIIYGSTVYVYSKYGSFYRSSKQSTELFIENYNKIYGLNYTILRFGSLYGKRANHFNFINKIINQALLEGKIERKGDGNEIREYINVLDAARASVEVLDEEYVDSQIILTGTERMKIKDLLHMVKEMFDNNIDVKYLNETFEEHYEITPYTFRPRVAKKYLLKDYHDLGQGILDCIYENYQELSQSDKNNLGNNTPKSI